MIEPDRSISLAAGTAWSRTGLAIHLQKVYCILYTEGSVRHDSEIGIMSTI